MAKKKISKVKIKDFAKKFVSGKTISKKIIRAGPRGVLDLRDRPEREGKVKQHGFKEDDISYKSVLGQ